MLRTIIILLLSIIFFSTTEFLAQSEQQLIRLLEIAEEQDSVFRIKKQEAIIKADQLGIPLVKKYADGRVKELMYFDEFDQPVYYITFNADAAETISTDELHPGGSTGYSLTGDGEVLGIWDGGDVLESHIEFNQSTFPYNRVLNNDTSTLGFGDHATHVAGTMIGEGNTHINPWLNHPGARGMAYEALLVAYDWSDDESEMASEAASGLYVSNHSYGISSGWHCDGSTCTWHGNSSISSVEDYYFGFYSNNAKIIDEIANNAPYYLICRAAGNDRGEGPGNNAIPDDGPYDCISDWGNSKNVLTVGAVRDISGGYSSSSGVTMTSFSSWGPTDDGRIKPDLVANGYNLWSPVNDADNFSYAFKSGTSMATPNVSGSIGLLLEHQRNLYGSIVFRSSTMKALLIHTADEAGSYLGPDYEFGWGLANFKKAAQLMEQSANDCINIFEYDLSQNEVIEVSVVKDPNQELRVTICWNDPFGTPVPIQLDPSDVMLVNDLDLRIIEGDGTATYYPWVLDRNIPSNAASLGDNIVDNVEQVGITSNYSSDYTIKISHKGNLQGGSQIVSVIVSGNDNITANLNIDNLTISNMKSYWAHQDISSTATIIDAPAEVKYIAGNSVSLLTGFHAVSGTSFNAKIDEYLICNPGTFGLKNNNLSVPPQFIYERNILPKP